jgi:hypothetical protein
MLRPLPDHCQHGVAGRFSRIAAGLTNIY